MIISLKVLLFLVFLEIVIFMINSGKGIECSREAQEIKIPLGNNMLEYRVPDL